MRSTTTLWLVLAGQAAFACRPSAGSLYEASSPGLATATTQQPATPGEPNATSPNEPVASPAADTVAAIFFSPYKYVSVAADQGTGALQTTVTGTTQPLLTAMPTLPGVTVAFATGECNSESWAGLTPAQVASNVATFVAAKVPYILSTGGADGLFTCGSDANFMAFLDRFASDQLAGVDFDLESGQSAAQIQALVDRVKVAQASDKYKNLRYSFTLPTIAGADGSSLSSIGETTLAAIQNDSLQGYFINLMVMDYGAPDPSVCVVQNGACQMGASAVLAAQNLQAKYKVPFSQIELTPLIGGNDVQGETFTVDDVTTMMAFVRANGVSGVHYWALDRDVDCTDAASSDTCNNYGKAGTLGYFNAFLSSLK